MWNTDIAYIKCSTVWLSHLKYWLYCKTLSSSVLELLDKLINLFYVQVNYFSGHKLVSNTSKFYTIQNVCPIVILFTLFIKLCSMLMMQLMKLCSPWSLKSDLTMYYISVSAEVQGMFDNWDQRSDVMNWHIKMTPFCWTRSWHGECFNGWT